uniref:Integrase, catalytic region, zinc finger, CCHC-type, peptidase aspartic, catalytic n=1 Tax=Tanacetum cinerariifolium TaxID=118510 RepID=A0A6L2KSF0_TANCI|nr:hypothetical protein [Tanacetum cinerariifolium]
MLYDEFDKFTSEPEESIHSYYLRFAKLINDMNMISMTMTPMQINMKFMNHLQPEWSRFVTTAKQARNLHKVTSDQLYAFLKHNEKDDKEAREMRQRFPKPLALLANTYNPPPSYSIVQQPPTFQPDTGLAIPTFLPTDDPIACLKKAMIFLSLVYRLKFPPTNNQLQTSSNLRTQATIQNGQVMVQNVQGRQSQGYAGNAGNNQASGARVINAVGNTGANQPRVIKCYNCIEQHDLLANSLEETGDYNDLQLQATTNFKACHVDAYDSDCDDKATSNAIFMANLSPVGSLNDDTVAPQLEYIENIVSTNESYDELKGNSDVISYTDYMLTIRNDADNYVPPSVQKSDMMLFVIEQIKSQVEHCNKFNECIKRRTTLSSNEIGSWEQSDIKEVKEMKDILKKMKDEVDQCSVAKKSFEIEKKQLLINNDRLLEENIASDIMCTYLRSLNEFDNCGKFKSLDIVLLNLQESNKSLSELRKRFARLEEYNITFDISFQKKNK